MSRWRDYLPSTIGGVIVVICALTLLWMAISAAVSAVFREVLSNPVGLLLFLGMIGLGALVSLVVMVAAINALKIIYNELKSPTRDAGVLVFQLICRVALFLSGIIRNAALYLSNVIRRLVIGASWLVTFLISAPVVLVIDVIRLLWRVLRSRFFSPAPPVRFVVGLFWEDVARARPPLWGLPPIPVPVLPRLRAWFSSLFPKKPERVSAGPADPPPSGATTGPPDDETTMRARYREQAERTHADDLAAKRREQEEKERQEREEAQRKWREAEEAARRAHAEQQRREQEARDAKRRKREEQTRRNNEQRDEENRESTRHKITSKEYSDACNILELKPNNFTKEQGQQRWRSYIKNFHPDKAGSTELAKQINSAWDTIQRYHGWR